MWYVQNAETALAEPQRERPRQYKGRPGPGKYGRDAFQHWSALLSRKGNSLEKAIKHKVGRILGCGKYGCVLEAGPKKVIKLSPLPEWNWQGDEELRFWTAMKAEQKRPDSPASAGVVGIDKVWVATDSDTDEKYMVVLRNDVQPFTKRVPYEDDPAFDVLVASDATRERGISLPQGLLRPEELSFYEETDNARVERATEGLLTAIREYKLGDVHLENVGWQGDVVVVSDADYANEAPPPDEELRVNREVRKPTELGGYDDSPYYEWEELLERKGDDLERALGVPLGDMLGCGFLGCVVRSAPGKVVKLTSAHRHAKVLGSIAEEVAFWTRVKAEQEDPDSPASRGVVRVDSVSMIEDKDTGDRYLAVVREDVVPAQADGRWTQDTLRRVCGKSDCDLPWIRDWPQAQDAVEAIDEYGLLDVHGGNVGWRGDKLVVYDAGAPMRMADVEELQRMRVNDRYSPFHERLPGGLASGMRPEDFDPVQLQKGIEVEMEHTSDRGLATEIAMDHLVEDPVYYDKLERMEANMGEREACTCSGSETGCEHAYWCPHYDVDRDAYEEYLAAFEGTPEEALSFEEWTAGDTYISDTAPTRAAAARFRARKASGGLSENARGFYVFEMRGNKPYRQVNVKPLTLTKAKQLARIGAQQGKHGRVVTTDPRKADFKVVAEYEVGT